MLLIVEYELNKELDRKKIGGLNLKVIVICQQKLNSI